jgi:hypothetical protein
MDGTVIYSSPPSYKATLSAVKTWPYKKHGLSWYGQFTSILLSQVYLKYGLIRGVVRWEGPYKRGGTMVGAL